MKNPFRKLRRILGSIRLRYKMLLFYILLFCVPMLITCFIILDASSSALLSNLSYSAEQGCRQARSFLEYKLSRIISVSDIIASNTALNAILGKEPDRYSLSEQVEDMNTMRVYLRSFQDDKDVYRVRIYVSDALLYSADKVNMFGQSDAEETRWYADMLRTKDTILFHPNTSIHTDEKNDRELITLSRPLVSLNDYRIQAAILRVDMYQEVIDEILMKANPSEDSVTYLANSSGALVACSGNEPLAGLYRGAAETESLVLDSTLQEIDIGGERMLVSGSPIHGSDWTFVTVIPYKALLRQTDTLRDRIFVLMVLFGIATCLAALLFTHSFTGRIHRLVGRMQEVRRGNTDILIENEYTDEIGVLYDSYNDMILQINALLKKTYHMGQELKSAELKALQSQINPHFLYNTLDMINWLSADNRAEEVQSVVSSLAKYYKLTLGKGREVVVLQDEIQHAVYYLNIQRTRFSGRIAYDFSLEDSLRDYPVPKITLQPIVENAILHGILEKEDKTGSIHIRAFQDEECTHITVQDDGVGIPQALLESLNRPDPAAGDNGSYGLKNIDQRIRLIYGEGYGLRFSSRENEGTLVDIRLPLSRYNP